MHIELQGNSLAECYLKFLNLDYVKVTDLCHRTKVVIDIDLDSPYDGSYLKVGTEINDSPWISVKDGLPKEGQHIVMHDREYDMYQTIYYPEPCITDRMDYWMPIIELPKEK